ncbi:unnamed protein product [Mytilus edulis]|uniref:C-type lectin domain-containing protein n=1 Tax=Mytilus edulis TaxID=6550 RepID=A0A8S3THA4_MYTED|nr:unnamed protein product [Mytilus edulis]
MVFLHQIVYILLSYQVVACTKKVGFTENASELDNIYFNEAVIFQIKGNMLECVMQCNHVTECMSVSHSNTSNECIGLSAGYVNGMKDIKGYHSDGWTYHLVLDSRCPKRSGYVYSKMIQSCYKIYGKNISLQSAEYDSKCGLEGAELMRIDSEEKQLLIATFIGKYLSLRADYFDVTSWILFQGSHLIAEEHWRYNDGSIINYFNWHSTQPDSTGNPGQTEVIGMRKSDGYKWHDLWLHDKGAFLCEKRIFD